MKKKKYMMPVYEKDFQRLTISYTCKKPDKEIDTCIKTLLKSLNFKWTGQGYDFLTNTRDISFVRKENNAIL